jgi:hypothetical protein
VSFAAITLCVAFQQVFVFYFIMTQSGNVGYTSIYNSKR